MRRVRIGLSAAAVLAGAALAATAGRAAETPLTPLSPDALAASADGRTVYAACATASRVAVVDPDSGKVLRTVALPAPPTGLALAPDGARLVVTCADPAGRVCVVDTASGTLTATLPAGHTTMSPVLSPDGKTLYVCNRFENAVSAFDLAGKKELYRAPVPREPVCVSVTPDGTTLLVANHLPSGPADADIVAGVVTVLDAATGKPSAEIPLPNGSTELRDIAVSPDGRVAAVAHLLARFRLPTTQTDRGWMNTNALTLIDVPARKRMNTVLLDSPDRGAANPWAVRWSPDGKTLAVTHAGTHDLSLIDAPALLAKLATRTGEDVPNDLGFLAGLRRVIPSGGQGPRALAFAGTRLVVSNYFSDSLAVVDPGAKTPAAVPLALGPAPVPSPVRRGEALFNDASIAFQGWQSCASCHSSDGRVDGLNWDLLNDGIGNPKNSRSLVKSFETTPVMSMGVRESAAMAVRAGVRVILFSVRPEEEAAALDEYIKSLKPAPSPALVNGKPTEAALRGEKLFTSPALGCSNCHAGPLLTNLKAHDVGTLGRHDKEGDRFITPKLLELWRTAPFLHDGSAATLMDVLSARNKGDRHGKTSHLTPPQLEDLVAYLLTL